MGRKSQSLDYFKTGMDTVQGYTKKKSNSPQMLQQILFLEDYTIICMQSLLLTVDTDTLPGNLMDGNFSCCPVGYLVLVRYLSKPTLNFEFSWVIHICDSKQEKAGISFLL